MLFLDSQSHLFRSFIGHIGGFRLPIHLQAKSAAVRLLALRDRLRDGFLRGWDHAYGLGPRSYCRCHLMISLIQCDINTLPQATKDVAQGVRAVKLLMKLARSTRLDILRRLLAAVADHLVLNHLTLVERAQAGTLDRGDMDEYVSAAVLRLNESIAFRRVEPFHGTGSHHGLL